MQEQAEILLNNRIKQKIPSKKFFLRVVNKSLQVLREKEKVVIAFIFISPQESRKLNRNWRKKDKIALVLSFPLKHAGFPTPSSQKLLGDIFLCPEMIKKKYSPSSLSQKDIYQKLIVHGLLHLYGYTHKGKKDTKEMENLEKKIINN